MQPVKAVIMDVQVTTMFRVKAMNGFILFWQVGFFEATELFPVQQLRCCEAVLCQRRALVKVFC